jgi:hypothetical protein
MSSELCGATRDRAESADRESRERCRFFAGLWAWFPEGKGGLPTVAQAERREVHLRSPETPRATVDNLRLETERRLVDPRLSSWNPMVTWLRSIEAMKANE